MKVKHVYNPLSGEMDLINTEESKTNVPKFEEIVDHLEFEVTSGSPTTDAGEVVFLATDKIFVWRTERGYFRNWATVLDYMTSWDGTPIKHRLFECNGQYYVFDGESLVHSTVNIGGSGIELVHGLGDSTEKAMSQAAVTNLYNQGYKLVGTATPSTTPITLTGDEKVFYIATEEGDYSNFGLGTISELSVIKCENGSWKAEGLGVPLGIDKKISKYKVVQLKTAEPTAERIQRAENANLFIKNIYLKKLPEDCSGDIFLRQILVNLTNIGNKIVIKYSTDGSAKTLIDYSSLDRFNFIENDYIKLEVDFSVYDNLNLSGEVLFSSVPLYFINKLASKDFIPANKQHAYDNSVNLSKSASDLVNSVIWNKSILYPTTNGNMLAVFKHLFKVSSANNVLSGEIGTLVDLSSHEFTAQEWFVTKFIKVKPNTTYTVSKSTYLQEFDENLKFIVGTAMSSAWAINTFTTGDTTSYIRVITMYTGSTISTTQQARYLNEGDTVVEIPPQNEIEGDLLGQPFDNSITERKLSDDLKSKINASTDLSKYTLYTIGDSMSAANKWQARVVELTEIQWSAERNILGGSPLSVGGTNTYDGFDSGLFRTWNLVKSGYIEGSGKNTLVIFQNVNDGKQVFTPVSDIFTPTQIIEGYNESDWGEALLGNITPKYGTIIKLLRNGVIGKNLSVTKLPTKTGNVTLKVGWSGPGIKNYNIAVTASETVQSILNKILEWQYDGITDSLSANGTSVDFSRGATDNSYPITVQFIDTDSTGMEVSIIDTNNASTSVAKYFRGDSLDAWVDVSSWATSLTWSEAFMASIEMVQRNYPEAKICVAIFPRHHATPNNYLRADGTYDTNKWLTTDSWELNDADRSEEIRKLCKYYNVDVLDVNKLCGISLSNYSTYYPDGNVHPNTKGYERIGEVVAGDIKRILL